MAFPFKIIKRSSYRAMKESMAAYIDAMHEKDMRIIELEEARKNDFRDPKTGRFTKGKK